jgi:polyketide synthase PksJ
MQATPATWQMLIDDGWVGKRDMKVLCGGDTLSGDLLDALATRSASVWNMYGPTETTIWSTTGRGVPGAGVTSLGRPIQHTDVHLLDAQLQHVPVGVPGEICIGGDGLARGYLGRPDLTAERFVPHPFARDPGSRLYRTGDRARLRIDGSLEFIGRADHQIKLRGFRIDPSEIELVLRTQPSVREGVVTVYEDHRNDKALVAYIVGESSNESSIRAQLAATLPGYMIPASFVFMSRLPLTPNGKLDRHALPKPYVRAHALRHAPDGELEVAIANIWREVLGTEHVGASDNFFDLGGHSLLVHHVQRRLEHTLGRDIPILELFRHPTVATLARYLNRTLSPAQSRDGRHSECHPRVAGATRLDQLKQRRLHVRSHR